jgi:hypothetical protein
MKKLILLMMMIMFTSFSFLSNKNAPNRHISSHQRPIIEFHQQYGVDEYSGKSFRFTGVIIVRAAKEVKIKRVGILWDENDEDFIHTLVANHGNTAGLYTIDGSFSGTPENDSIRFFVELTNGEKQKFKLDYINKVQ